LQTGVSETIRKPPLAEAQTASGKQINTFCGTLVSIQLAKLCENCFPAQNLTEIGQSAAELWLKTIWIFNMAAVRQLEF